MTAARRVRVYAGLSKNAGKTTAVVRDVESREHGVRYGFITNGYEGEHVDAIHGHAKPGVSHHEDDLVVTSSSAPDPSRIVDVLGSPGFGPKLVVARASAKQRVPLIGPRSVRAFRVAIDSLERAGAERIVVDGSFDRRGLFGALDGVELVLAVAPTDDESLDRTLLRLRMECWLHRSTRTPRTTEDVVASGLIDDDRLRASDVSRRLRVAHAGFVRATPEALAEFAGRGGSIGVDIGPKLLRVVANPTVRGVRRVDPSWWVEQVGAASGAAVADVVAGLYYSRHSFEES